MIKEIILASLAMFFSSIAAILFYQHLHPTQKTPVTAIPASVQMQKPVYADTADKTVNSPDGTHTIVVKQTQKGSSITYTVSSKDEAGQETILFTKILPATITFSLPANAWSPDNKYIFLNEFNQGKATVYVINTKETTPEAVDISSIFAAKDGPYTFQEATGWASPELIIVETTVTATGAQGPTFWYDTTSKGFIQLARRQ